MCFCLLSPMTRFEAVCACLDRLSRAGVLNRLSTAPACVEVDEIRRLLSLKPGSCRFPDQKARRLAAAGCLFYDDHGRGGILGFLREFVNAGDARKALVMNVAGLGMKEASHFLRNIGRGRDVAVLDVHLRRFMSETGMVSQEIAGSGSRMNYESMEEAFTSLAFNSGLETSALDLAIWEYMRGR